MNNYTLDGVPLLDPQKRWFPDKSSGVRVVPAKRTGHLAFPGSDGESITPGDYDPGQVTINLYVRGKTHKEFMQNKEFIDGLMGQRSRLMKLEHSYDGKTVDRVADVHMSTSVDPSLRNNKALAAVMSYLLEVPGAFWRSPDTITTPAYVGTTTDTTHTLPNMGNAPINDALIRIKGGFSSFTVTDPITKDWVKINQSVTTAQYVIIDTKTWITRIVSADTWTGGTDISRNVEQSRGYGNQWVMEPDVYQGAMRYRIITRATNPASSPSVMIRARKAYL